VKHVLAGHIVAMIHSNSNDGLVCLSYSFSCVSIIFNFKVHYYIYEGIVVMLGDAAYSHHFRLSWSGLA